MKGPFTQRLAQEPIQPGNQDDGRKLQPQPGRQEALWLQGGGQRQGEPLSPPTCLLPAGCGPQGRRSFFAVTGTFLQIRLKAATASPSRLSIQPVLQRPLLSELIATGKSQRLKLPLLTKEAWREMLWNSQDSQDTPMSKTVPSALPTTGLKV